MPSSLAAGNSSGKPDFMRATYLTVAGRVRRELQELAQVVERTQQIWQQGSSTVENTGATYYVDAVALNLHGFYAGVERWN